MINKCTTINLAGVPKAAFKKAQSITNSVQPDFDRFLMYSQIFFEQRHYTNNGPLVRQLEKRLAAFHRAEYCIAVSSSFWAMVLAIRCLALSDRTEIVMPSRTYRQFGDVATWAGLIPRYYEVDPDSLVVSVKKVEALISKDTSLLVGVQPTVSRCNGEKLQELAAAKKLPLLFDSAEAIEKLYKEGASSPIGHAQCFSLEAGKLINGFEGGYIITNDARLAKRIGKMRGFGFFGQDNVEELGMNAKLNEMHAAMALASLDSLDIAPTEV